MPEGKKRYGLYVMVVLIFVMLFYVAVLVERIGCAVNAVQLPCATRDK